MLKKVKYWNQIVFLIKKSTNFYSELKSKKLRDYYEYLPLSNEKGLIIDFSMLSSVKIEELDGEYKREMGINETFLKEIITNFSKYYGKQGIPELY